jgi:hypothetical protein
MSQMRMGVAVPCARKETSIDMMHEVLSQSRLHLHAASGYKATGATVALDGSEDHLVVNAAGQFFKDLDMRRKLNAEIEVVRDEVAAGRLQWSKATVKQLICEYPKRSAVDSVLQNIGEHAGNDEGGAPWEDIEAEPGESDDGGTESDVACDHEKEVPADDTIAHTLDEGCQTSVTEKEGLQVTTMTAEEADGHQKSQVLLDVLQKSARALREIGALAPAAQLQHHIRMEQRRLRDLATESTAVAAALARQKDEERRREYLARKAAAELNRRRETATSLQRQLDSVKNDLKKKKADIAEHEKLVLCKYALKTYSLEQLGQGSDTGGGAAGRKRRMEVLDRMAQLGNSLSPQQRNDWDWFKHSWDEKMLAEHGREWGGVFAGWMQRVIVDHGNVCGNAFSVFMHAETERNFHGTQVLQVPGVYVSAKGKRRLST